MKNTMILTAVISAIFAGSACAKTPVKTPEKTVSQTTQITQKDFDKLESDYGIEYFTEKSKFVPELKQMLGNEYYDMLLGVSTVGGVFKKSIDENTTWYDAHAISTQNSYFDASCISLNNQGDIYIAISNLEDDDKTFSIKVFKNKTNKNNSSKSFKECLKTLSSYYPN